MTQPEAEIREVDEHEAGSHRLAAVTNAIVRLFKEYVGRGPTEARTHLMGGMVVVVLEGASSQSDRKLLDHGDVDAVLNHRRALQRALREEAVAAVEDALGRNVLSFMSASDPLSDLQFEIFVLGEREDHFEGGGLSERTARASAAHRDRLDEMRALRAEQVTSREALRRTREHSGESHGDIADR